MAPGDGVLVFLYPEKDTFNVINVGSGFSPEGAASKTGWMGSFSPLRIDSISMIPNPCLNLASVIIHPKHGRSGFLFSLDNSQFQSDSLFDGLLPGVHIINLTDNSGCLDSYGPFTVPDMKSDSIFKFNIEPDYCILNRGVINIIYALKNNDLEFSLDAISWQNEPRFENLSEGSYNIYVRYPTGCLDTLHAFLPAFLPLETTFVVTDENCNLKDGKIEILANGGVGPYQYGFVHDLTFSSDFTIDSLSSGEYEVFVFDSNGCSTQTNVMVGERNPKISLIETRNPFCSLHEGSINIEVQNAILPILYSINSGSNQSSSFFDQLVAGEYDIIAVDETGCRLDTNVILNKENHPPKIQVEISNATCNESNGIITVHSFQNELLFSLNESGFQQDSLFYSLEPGTYTLLTMTAEGCYDSTVISIIQLGRPKFMKVDVLPDHCNQQQGSIIIQSTQGGVGPYEYKIQNNGFQNALFFEGLISGDYNLVVRDSSGCYDSLLVSVGNIEGPIVTSTVIQPAHCKEQDGSIQINTKNESALLFTLDHSTSTDGYFIKLGTGSYSLIIEDSFGCYYSQEIFIPDTTSLHIDDIKVTNSSCKYIDGNIEIKSTGDNVSFTIEEMPDQKWYEKVQNLSSGTYHLSLIDMNNCTIDTVVTVLRDDNCLIRLPNIFSPNGDQINDEFGSFPFSEFSKWNLSIFDRSGNMVFSSNDPNIAWDGIFKGQNAQSGVYTWYLKYKSLGEDVDQSELGNVTLLR